MGTRCRSAFTDVATKDKDRRTRGRDHRHDEEEVSLMKRVLGMAGAAGLLLTSLVASPSVAGAAERATTMNEPAAATDPVFRAVGNAVVEFERLIGTADGAPEN